MIDILEDLRGHHAVSSQAAEHSSLHQTHHIVALALAAVKVQIATEKVSLFSVASGKRIN